jgi:hypothetical protein
VVARTTGPAAESVSTTLGCSPANRHIAPIRSRGHQHAGAGLERARCPMTLAVTSPEEEIRPRRLHRLKGVSESLALGCG